MGEAAAEQLPGGAPEGGEHSSANAGLSASSATELPDETSNETPARRRRLAATVTLLFLAPAFGEVLSTATAPLDLLMPWTLMLMFAMYGCGALLCRELTRRFGLGLPGLLLLGAAYGIYEEGLVDRYFYDRAFWDETGVGDYSTVGELNLLLASHLTLFHAAVSVVCSIVVVERLFPDVRSTPWVRNRGLILSGLALCAVVVVFWEDFYVPSVRALLGAVVAVGLLVTAAFLVPGRRRARASANAAGTPPIDGTGPDAIAPTTWLGVTAFACTALHFGSVYLIAHTPMPWPAGVALTGLPVAAGVLVVRRRGRGRLDGQDALRVVTGIVSFFLMLNIVFGLAGRYDMTLAALGLTWLMWWVQRRASRSVAA